jgi:hypothetical protein
MQIVRMALSLRSWARRSLSVSGPIFAIPGLGTVAPVRAMLRPFDPAIPIASEDGGIVWFIASDCA